jgi:ABC-2 type transport system ATP-binding protein
MPETSNAIECHGLVKRYGALTAVDSLDLVIARGECFGLLGPNGAGKTTTIEILEGLTAADAGQVRLLGESWGNDDRALRERLGISLQETRLNERLTVFETLRLFRSFYRRGRPPAEVMAEMSLEEKAGARVGRLSGGQRQRLAVACALVGDPEILFLDEPTTGLDPQSRRQLWEKIVEFRGRGGTVLLTTHYMDEAERLCDRVAILDHGRILVLGTPRDLVAQLRAPYVVELVADPDPADGELGALAGIHDARRRAGRWALTVDSLAQSVPAILQELERRGSRLVDLSTHQATLEDVFVALTGRELRED